MTLTPLKISRISIIIPTLNEEENISLLSDNLTGSNDEVIIVDGGSSDNTTSVASKKGFLVIESPVGRAWQLNRGAKIAKGEYLLFLHADTELPPSFGNHILTALSDQKTIAGAFSLAIRKPTPGMTFIAHCANLRSRLFQLPYGDQAIFIGREDFFRLGQFPEMQIMEDYAFIKKVRKNGKVVTLKQHVTTSARRWQRLGVFRTTVINQLVILGYNLNIPLEHLVSLYRR